MNRQEQFEALKKPLDGGRVKQLGGARGSIDYLETFDVINHLNEIFGFDGWQYQTIKADPVDAALHVWRADVLLKVRFEGGEWINRSDIGFGSVTMRSDGRWIETPAEYEKAIKGAVSDGLKRCARTLGNQFGNSLYDKDPMARYDHGDAHPDTAPQRPTAAPQSPAARPQSQSAPAPRNDKMGGSNRAPVNDGEKLTGYVERVSKKDGEGARGPWVRYAVQVNGDWYSTFDHEIGMRAIELDGCEATLTWRTGRQGLDLLFIEGVQQAQMEPGAGDVDDSDPFADE